MMLSFCLIQLLGLLELIIQPKLHLGKILTGGVDANALQNQKDSLGLQGILKEEGVSSIIATALIDTGSRMDEVIFEEFKGTGNSEINLDRKIAEKRVFPINVRKTGTRREDLLTSELELRNITVLRKLQMKWTTLRYGVDVR